MSQPRDVEISASSKDEGFDVEVKDRSPSPPSEDSNLDDANDNTDIESAALPEKGSKSGSRTIIHSFLSKSAFGSPWIVILIVGGLTFVVGSAVYRASSSAGNIQQEKSVAVANVGGKGGKAEPSSFAQLLCDTLQCGLTITDKKVVLKQDLKCRSPAAECAIILDGPDAELDCSKHMIYQVTSVGFDKGICLYNGARAKNCYVQKFSDGIYIENGGEVKDSEVMFNNGRGIDVYDNQGSTTKISNTYVHDIGADGIRVLGRGGSSIQIQGVKSNENGQFGMSFTFAGPGDITYKVKDSETSRNEGTGLFIKKDPGPGIIKVDLEGSINSGYNRGDGMRLDGLDVTVKGVLNIYKSSRHGFNLRKVNVVVEKGGYLNACLNGDGDDEDIRSRGSATFSGLGTYTCDKKGPPGYNLPVCETCPSCQTE